MIDPQLAGKVALVTGANHGIGAATAKALIGFGPRYGIIHDISPPGPAVKPSSDIAAEYSNLPMICLR